MVIIAAKLIISQSGSLLQMNVLVFQTTNTNRYTDKKENPFFSSGLKPYDFIAICWSKRKLQVATRRRPTCSQEHDFVLSVFCHHSVNHNLSQGVVLSDTCEERPAGQRVDRAVHERVEPDEADHLVWEVFGRLDLGIVGLTGTLMEGMSSTELLLMNMLPWRKHDAALQQQGPFGLYNLLSHVSLCWSESAFQEAEAHLEDLSHSPALPCRVLLTVHL